MEYLYIATVFAGSLVCFLASLLLFVRRKAGGRSRIILAVIVFFSVINYITRFIDLCRGEVPEFIVSADMLLLANFMVISYIMYPVEVISPGWMNLRRIIGLYSIWLFFVFVYVITLVAGVNYTQYASVLDMFQDAGKFDVWFRLIMTALIIAPLFFVFFIHRSTRYNNSDLAWLKRYSSVLFINIVAYLSVLFFNHQILHIVYYYLSVGCSLYIVYMELFDRLISSSLTEISTKEKSLKPQHVQEIKNSALTDKLDSYMKKNNAWRDPNLTLNMLASELCTNRTTLASVMRQSGIENYTNYINRLRIEDFRNQIESGNFQNYQEAFFYVGFRSRSTALRNFRQFTGMTPSEFYST